METTKTPVDYLELTTRQRSTWATGDFHQIARLNVPIPEALVERARNRAAVDGLDATFAVADAQALPFADDSFDAMLSVYGVQFAPNQETAAEQMLRVVPLRRQDRARRATTGGLER